MVWAFEKWVSRQARRISSVFLRSMVIFLKDRFYGCKCNARSLIPYLCYRVPTNFMGVGDHIFMGWTRLLHGSYTAPIRLRYGSNTGPKRLPNKKTHNFSPNK